MGSPLFKNLINGLQQVLNKQNKSNIDIAKSSIETIVDGENIKAFFDDGVEQVELDFQYDVATQEYKPSFLGTSEDVEYSNKAEIVTETVSPAENEEVLAQNQTSQDDLMSEELKNMMSEMMSMLGDIKTTLSTVAKNSEQDAKEDNMEQENMSSTESTPVDSPSEEKSDCVTDQAPTTTTKSDVVMETTTEKADIPDIEVENAPTQEDATTSTDEMKAEKGDYSGDNNEVSNLNNKAEIESSLKPTFSISLSDLFMKRY